MKYMNTNENDEYKGYRAFLFFLKTHKISIKVDVKTFFPLTYFL